MSWSHKSKDANLELGKLLREARIRHDQKAFEGVL